MYEGYYGLMGGGGKRRFVCFLPGNKNCVFLCFVKQVLVLCSGKINICSENNFFSFDKPSHFYVLYTLCHNVL